MVVIPEQIYKLVVTIIRPTNYKPLPDFVTICQQNASNAQAGSMIV
jgi:hypothetical protein